MDNLLIKSAKIVFPDTPFRDHERDVLIKDGVVTKIAARIKADGNRQTVVDAKGQYLAPGFFDMNVNFGEPGLETKEDIVSGCAAAAAGGFTGVAVQPNTQPSLHSRSRSEEHTSELQSLMRISYAVFCLKKTTNK